MMLGVPIIKDYEKYLGLPSFVGRQKKLALIKSRSAFGLNARVEGEVAISSRKRGGDQSCGPIDPYIFYECVSLSCWTSKRY